MGWGLSPLWPTYWHWKHRCVLPGVVMWARIWDLCPSRKTPETASRNWASARLETECCASCWWEARTIFWDRLVQTPIYDDSGCGCASAAERTPRNVRPSQWHENWPFCCIDSG